jgi:3-hydroxyisobutyrate dehydrogenase-like beta-hydroxyacid dehydrogenase
MVKDLTTALALAGRTETEVPLSQLALELWREAGGDLEAGADHTALARWYEKRTGTQLRS